MPRPNSLKMADRLMGGDLAVTVQRYRAAGVSWAAIVRLLSTDHGVEVSEKTLRESWAPLLGIEEPAA